MEIAKTIDEIIDHPYLVYSSAHPTFSKKYNIDQYLNNIEIRTPEDSIISILDILYNDAYTKETTFFQKIVDNITLSDEIKNQMRSAWEEGKSGKAYGYSKFMTYYDALRKGLIDTTASMEEAISKVKQFYSNFTYKADDELIHSFFNSYDATNLIMQTPNKVFEDFYSYIMKNDKYASKGKDVLDIYAKTIKQWSADYFSQTSTLGEKYIFSEKDLKPSVNNRGKTVDSVYNTLMSSLIGTFRGKTLEVAIGDVVTGALKEAGKNIETDVYQFLNIDLQRDYGIEKKIEESLEQGYNALKKTENDFIASGGYAIRYSAKAGGENSDIKIKGTASYLYRMEEIKGLFTGLGFNQSQYRNFLFTLANTCQGFIASNRWKQVEQILTQIAVIWMFDDVVPNLSFDENAGAGLNFYNIRGHIITSSELFLRLKDSLAGTIGADGRKTKKFLAFTRKKASFKEDPSMDWDEVYRYYLSANEIGLNMKSKNLIQAIFDF